MRPLLPQMATSVCWRKNGLQEHLEGKEQAIEGSRRERQKAVLNVFHSKVKTGHRIYL